MSETPQREPAASRTFDFASADEPFRPVRGGALSAVRVDFTTHGKLNEARDNAILIFHALSGSHHIAGRMEQAPQGAENYWDEDCREGWWSAFVGPGLAIDTDRFFVVCANLLGGCYGSTGPASPAPETGHPYGSRFPHVTARDQVEVQARLLDHLGIATLHAVIGVSIGGLLALTFATTFPHRVRRVIPIASGVRTTVLNRLILFEQILAIENDPHFRGGDYYDGAPPALGLALARMISHKTFVHLDAIERRARGSVVQSNDHFDWYRLRDAVESYMLHQGRKFVGRFDANTYLRLIDMWSGFDPVAEAGARSMSDLLGRCREAGQHFLVFTIDSDFCFYPEEQAALVSGLHAAGVSHMYATVHSEKGHDSFLLEPDLYAPHLRFTLDRRIS